MPRKPRSKPVAAHLTEQPETATAVADSPQQLVEQLAESFALPQDLAHTATTDYRPEPAQTVDTGAGVDPVIPATKPPFTWARIESSGERQIGIKVETEQERKPGINHPRTLIRFRDDMLPTSDEKAKLKAEGFKYCPDVQAWGTQKSAASKVLALRIVSDLAKGRGYEGSSLYI